MRAIDIKWDTDGDEEILKTLPKEMDIPDDVDEENVADWLSDETGFCVFGFVLEAYFGNPDNPLKNLLYASSTFRQAFS